MLMGLQGLQKMNQVLYVKVSLQYNMSKIDIFNKNYHRVIVVLKPTQQLFQLYHGENKLIFNEMMMRSTLYQTNKTQIDFYSASSPKQVRGQTTFATQTHYPDSEPTSLCSFRLMLCAQRRSNNYQFHRKKIVSMGLQEITNKCNKIK